MSTTIVTNLKKSLLVASIVALMMVAVIVIWQIIHVSPSSDRRLPVYDDKLSSLVGEYLMENPKGVLSDDWYDSYGNLLQGQSENYCDAGIFGYDDKYIYSLVTCQEYGWRYDYNSTVDEENTIEITRSMQQGTGWSSHVRLEYKEGTDFEIIDHAMPRGGSTYDEDLAEMFAPMGEIGSRDEQKIFENIRNRFRREHANDPYPDKIERIYDLSNPKVIIGGEVSA